MSVSRVKTMVISALLLLNVFFILIYITDNIGEASERRRIAEGVIRSHEQYGIHIEGEIKIGEKLRLYRTTRDLFAESKAADAVLGGGEQTVAPSGGIARFEGTYGTAQFNALGAFNIDYLNGYPTVSDIEDTARRITRSMKIDVGDMSVQGEKIVISAKYKGDVVINCGLTFEFENGILQRVSGRWAFGVTEHTEEQQFYELQSLLMMMLASVKNGEMNYTRVTDIERAYRFISAATGEGELSPGWIITTDKGVWFADAVTGQFEQTGFETTAQSLIALE